MQELDLSSKVSVAAESLRARAPEARPQVALILGTGLGSVAERIEDAVRLPYASVPHFPTSMVDTHAGELVLGTLAGKQVMALSGRFHAYEGYTLQEVTFPVRVAKALGAQYLIVANAAGGVNPLFKAGDLMLITDHINFLGLNPLVGPNDDSFGPRFFPVADAWDQDLRAKVKAIARQEAVTLHEGVYVAFRGPSFETPAEIRMAQGWGGDAVGMSSVPDCLIARHCGMKVVGISCLTNMGAGLSDEILTHAHTLENAAKGAGAFERLVLASLPVLG